jgi:hypothetical protein
MSADMTARSYAQIRWHQDRFGLLMINTRRERFFLHADKLQELYDHDNCYHVLKLRDRRPSSAIGYYAGQVVGALVKTEESIRIKLYISNPHRDVTFKLVNGLEVPDAYDFAQVFVFPDGEFTLFKSTLDTMLVQARQFSDTLRAVEMTPRQQQREVMPDDYES